MTQTYGKPHLQKPRKLRPGDRVGIVAPAGAVDPAALKKGMTALKRMGLRPVLGAHVYGQNRFCAGSDRERAEDLTAMFANPDIRAIVCARGGYGVNRILPLLRPEIIRENPKIFVGASDITLLLAYLNQRCSLVAFHGPMVAGNFGRHAMRAGKSQFRDLLAGKAEGRVLRSPRAVILRPGTARGALAGGCLTLLCRSLGTPYEIQTRGKLLLIEDVNEKPYRIDGMLWQLQAAGKFQGVRGIVFGEMVNCRPGGTEKYSLEEVVADFFKNDKFPVAMNFPIGHGREMWTLPLGVEATLDAEAKCLTLRDCGVV